MDDDERFGTLFHRAVGTLDAPTQRLVEGALARGRRQRRWIRGAELGTGAAVLAGLAVLGATFLGAGAARHPGPPTGAVGRPTANATTVVMTPQALLQTALDTLPRPGTATRYAGSAFDGSVSASFLYDDGAGAAEVDVALTYPLADPGPKDEIATPCDAGTEGCTVLPDGSHAQARQAHQYSDKRPPNATEYDLDLVRPDGVLVRFVEYNAPSGKDVSPTRALPPFSIAELTAWARNPQWQVRISGQRAAAAAHLFTPAPAPGSAAAAQAAARRAAAALRAERAATCRQVQRTHATPPAYCR